MTDPRQPLQLLIGHLQCRSTLDADDRDAVLRLPWQTRTLEAGSYTVREAEPPPSCMILTAGFAFRQKLTGDGARQIVGLHIPGDPLDLQNLFFDVSDHSVQMLTRGTVAMLNRAEVQKLARTRPNIGHAILMKILAEASWYREWLLNIGRRSARARIAHLLCELAVRLDAEGLTDHYACELPMTQEQLGDALGLTAVHVNRTLRALEADGFISRTRRSIRFPDWQRLREIGDFNERYLHLPSA